MSRRVVSTDLTRGKVGTHSEISLLAARPAGPVTTLRKVDQVLQTSRTTATPTSITGRRVPAPRPQEDAPEPRQEQALEVFCVGSAGGHLAQLRVLAPWLDEQRTTWVTFDLPDAQSSLAGRDVVYAFSPTTRSLKNLVKNLGLAWRLVHSRRPDLIVSTGAGVALPFFIVGRLFGARTSYIEVVDRIDSKTLTGRLCRPFSDLFMVQTSSQQALYPEAVLVGRLL
jgi:hypothetical protein